MVELVLCKCGLPNRVRGRPGALVLVFRNDRCRSELNFEWWMIDRLHVLAPHTHLLQNEQPGEPSTFPARTLSDRPYRGAHNLHRYILSTFVL